MKYMRSYLTFTALSLLIYSASTNPLWSMINQDGFEERGNQFSSPRITPNNNALTPPKPLISKEDEDSFKKTLAAFKDLRTHHPDLRTLEIDKPTCFLSYAWGNKDHETIVHTLAGNLRDAGINILLDIWINKGGTSTMLFAQKILDNKTDFVVLCGSKKLMEKLDETNESNSVVRVEVLDLIAQRLTWATKKRNILPILLEGRHEEVLPPFLGNIVSIGFQDRENYCLNCFSLLERIYQLPYDDPHLIKIKEKFKSANISENLKELKIEIIETKQPVYKTRKELEKEALKGNRQSAYELGMMYLEGLDVRKDITKGLQWLEKAAAEENDDIGSLPAQLKLAKFSLEEAEKGDKNYEKALKWIDLAIEKRDAEGQSLLGHCYSNGWGEKKDEAKAIQWYQKSADQKYEPAQKALSLNTNKEDKKTTIKPEEKQPYIPNASGVVKLPPTVSDIVIPEIARGYEEIYRRFVMGKLIYKPDPKSDKGRIELPIRALANPLEGTFDLSQCDNSGKYLSISTGYRKGKVLSNANKTEIWIAPRFLIEKELQGSASHFKHIMSSWDVKTAPIGLFYTWGGWDNQYYDYTTESMDSATDDDLYQKWKGRRSGEARTAVYGTYTHTHARPDHKFHVSFVN